MNLYYHRDGSPADDDGHVDLFSQDRRVAYTKVTDAADLDKSYDISTIFLVINHAHGIGAPLLFETMVFKSGESTAELCERYETEEQALIGHRGVTATVAAEMTDPIVADEDRPTR